MGLSPYPTYLTKIRVVKAPALKRGDETTCLPLAQAGAQNF
jgi:hypothetical protein